LSRWDTIVSFLLNHVKQLLTCWLKYASQHVTACPTQTTLPPHRALWTILYMINNTLTYTQTSIHTCIRTNIVTEQLFGGDRTVEVGSNTLNMWVCYHCAVMLNECTVALLTCSAPVMQYSRHAALCCSVNMQCSRHAVLPSCSTL